MKKTFYSIFAAGTLLILSACGGAEAAAEDHAEELCSCLTEAGLDNSLSILTLQDRTFRRDMEDKMENEIPTCALKVFREIEEDMDDMSKNEKKEYTKSFLKSCIDTDCADIALSLVPYDMMGLGLNEAENQLKRQRSYRSERKSREEEETMEDYDDLEDLFR
jgi:hypothetical protein